MMMMMMMMMMEYEDLAEQTEQTRCFASC